MPIVVAELVIPAFAVELCVTTLPAAFNLLAVIASIISMSETCAPLIKISSLSDLISYKLPNVCVSSCGTITNVVRSGC